MRTGSTNLTRMSARGPLVFVEPGGALQATVLSQELGKGQGESLGDAAFRAVLLHYHEAGVPLRQLLRREGHVLVVEIAEVPVRQARTPHAGLQAQSRALFADRDKAHGAMLALILPVHSGDLLTTPGQAGVRGVP